MPAIFISYRREDSAGYAGRLHEELEERFGPSQVFRDVDTLRAGQDFEEAIRARLQQCQACVVMIGPGWLKAQRADGARRLDQPDDYVAMEIAGALARPDVLVVPVLVGGATMPATAELPESIRALARRHAMSARDETWEADMDRLASILRQAAPPRPTPAPSHTAAAAPSRNVPSGLPRYALAAAAVLVILGTLALFLWRGDSAGSATRTRDDETAPLVEGAAYAIDVPTTGAEVAHGDLIFAVVAGSVQPRGNGMRVWLRVRASNEGFTSTNFWDQAFRLVAGGDAIAASGGLNEILEHRSIAQGVVRFDLPTRPDSATLRITYQGRSGDIPLDLSSNGSPPRHEERDERDALSHAVLTAIIRNETPLLATDTVSLDILRSSRRAFANVQRIVVVVKWTNRGRYPIATSDLTARLRIAGETLAPMRMPAEVVAPESTYVGDILFEVPPEVRKATLTASVGEMRVEREITLY